MPRPNIELQIDELVLDGIPYGQRLRVAAAIEQELSRLLTESSTGMNAKSADCRLSVPVIEVSGQSSAEVIGRQVARSVYGNYATPNANPTVNKGGKG